MAKDRTVRVARDGRRNVERAVAQRPCEDGLNVEPLLLALLVVGGDPLGGLGLDVVDAQDIADRMRAAHAGAASVATFRLVLLVNGAAGVANKERRRGESSRHPRPAHRAAVSLDGRERRGPRDRSGCAGRIPRSRETARAGDRRPSRPVRCRSTARRHRAAAAESCSRAGSLRSRDSGRCRNPSRRSTCPSPAARVARSPGPAGSLPSLRSSALRPCISDLRFASFSWARAPS